MAIIRFTDSVIKNQQSHTKIKFFIANLFTLANAILGLCAIFAACHKQPLASALLIFIAACFDGCDGKVARAFGVSTAFGSELDSLADAISFCLAPALLIMTYFPQEYAPFCIAMGALYLCSGLWRLARFNSACQNHVCHFIGLPTTISAITIAFSLLIRHLYPFISIHTTALIIGSQTIFLALLMVSCIPFAKCPKNPVIAVSILCTLCALFTLYLPFFYVISFIWSTIQLYIFSYCVAHLVRKK
jgi:CDP-diacylglycerol---serine O-phosphatidyltransferase